MGICIIACSHAVAQTPTLLPPQWNEAVTRLADKIAADVSPLHPLSFETKNISGLDAAEVANLQAALEAELKNRSFRIAAADSTSPQSITDVQFTVSQGVAGYILAAEIHTAQKDTGAQAAIVSAPKSPPGAGQQPGESLTLSKRLVWQQPEKILDFVLFSEPAGTYSTLVILEPDRLVSYRSSDAEWQAWRSVPIAHAKPWPRDLAGQINVDEKIVILPGVQCSGDLSSLENFKCSASDQPLDGGRAAARISGRDESSQVQLDARCGANSVIVATGTGDWIQSDSMQGYLSKDRKQPPVSSGVGIEFDGPVVALNAQGRESAARAIVLNLKTGNYEGYIVTATCSH
jgi:hypothetical protein